MAEKENAKKELLAEIDELKLRLIEAEETINAIQSGEVDALIVDTVDGSQTFTLEGADYIYRILIEQMNQGVAILTPDFTIYYCNKKLASMAKIPLEKLIGRKIIDFIRENDLNKGETEFKAEDGTTIPINVFIKTIEDTNSLYAIITDLSYFKLTEQQLEEQTAEIEEANVNLKENELKLKEAISNLKRSNEELESFAYITSHDLQEPLRTIASYAQLLERRYHGKLDSDADDFLDFMVDGAIRMKEQIQSLLEYSRINREIEFMETDMNLKLEKAISDLKTTIDESKAEITRDNLPTVKADPNQMIRVFENLITNAIKYKKPQFPPRIHFSSNLDINKKEWIFSVADNGIGIEPLYIDQIFEVFKKLHPIGEYEGTGIGLAIVKRIIERHGGHVWVESKYGVGSTFYFTIPVQSDDVI